MGCHDTGIYTRTGRIVQSLDALKEQLAGCSHMAQKEILGERNVEPNQISQRSVLSIPLGAALTDPLADSEFCLRLARATVRAEWRFLPGRAGAFDLASDGWPPPRSEHCCAVPNNRCRSSGSFARHGRSVSFVPPNAPEIGRASCRERVWRWVGVV